MYPLTEIENKYRRAISSALESKKLSASLLVELSSKLYEELKVDGIPDEIHSDVLLFQYGIYDWNDEYGRHFCLDITRQFHLPSSYEPYQLSFSLIYDSEQLGNIAYHHRWSMDFVDLESFISHITATDGYKLAENHTHKTYRILFEQC